MYIDGVGEFIEPKSIKYRKFTSQPKILNTLENEFI